MIELGQEVFKTAHTPFDRGDLHPNEFTAQLLATVAEAHHQGLDVTELLSPFMTPENDDFEHAESITYIQHTLADAFTTPDRLLLPEDFGVVSVASSTGALALHVMLTTPTGLYGGSYNAVMSNDEAYTITIGEQEVDTRKVMTRRIHRAMSVQALGKYLAEPSKRPLRRATDDKPRTATWYTGDNLNKLGQAPFGYDDDIYPDRHWWGRGGDSPSVLVRPGVKITNEMLDSIT